MTPGSSNGFLWVTALNRGHKSTRRPPERAKFAAGEKKGDILAVQWRSGGAGDDGPGAVWERGGLGAPTP